METEAGIAVRSMADGLYERMGGLGRIGVAAALFWVAIGIFPASARTKAILLRKPASMVFPQGRISHAKPQNAPARLPIATKKLHRIIVRGNQIPSMIGLDLLRSALHRVWSTSRKDRNLEVCRFIYGFTHLMNRAYLLCMTNGQHFEMQAAGEVPYMVAEFMPEVKVDPNQLRRLFAKLPKFGTSYELEVTHHGKPVSEWFMKRGQLVKVIYFKKGKEPMGHGKR